MLAELLINLPGQSRGNICEIIGCDKTFITLQMADKTILTVLPKDVRIFDND